MENYLERIGKIYEVYLLYQNDTQNHNQALALVDLAKSEFDKMFSQSGELTRQEIDLGLTQGKIAAIKEHRARTRMGLKESKDIVEEYFLKNGLRFYNYGY
jgi:ribosomal protein L7/L12